VQNLARSSASSAGVPRLRSPIRACETRAVDGSSGGAPQRVASSELRSATFASSRPKTSSWVTLLGMEEGKRVTTESRYPIGFAHRGARAHAPENTLSAFALALEMGAGALESDVWLTADGIAVLDHDGLVDGVKVESVPAAALPSHIPRLSDLYRECGTCFELSLDVKDGRSAVEVLRVAQAADAVPRLWLCHWNWKVLLPWREASPAVRLVDSTSTTHMRTPVPERAARMRRLGSTR
jgi:hypothetical protein